jgi:hypothetical protein
MVTLNSNPTVSGSYQSCPNVPARCPARIQDPPLDCQPYTRSPQGGLWRVDPGRKDSMQGLQRACLQLSPFRHGVHAIKIIILFVILFVCPSVCLSFGLAISLSVCLLCLCIVYLYFFFSIYPSFFLFFFLAFVPYFFLSLQLSYSLSASLFVCLPFCLSVCY